MGDINGDGRISIGDINQANLHAKGKKILLGYELACAAVSYTHLGTALPASDCGADAGVAYFAHAEI